MQRPPILPGSPEHTRLISPSKVPAICNISRWESQYTIWHRLKGLIGEQPPQDIFNVGLAFEHALAEMWRQDNPGWRLSRGEVQYTSNRFGFPAVATIDRRGTRYRHQRVVEFKIARSLEAWGDPTLDGDCPADYALQVMAQMAFSGIHQADLSVMGPFFKHHTYTIAWDETVASWMLGECKWFWDSLSGSVPPPLDDSLSTYETVRLQHPDIIGGLEVEIPESLATDWRTARSDSNQAERTLRGLKTKVLDAVGNAQLVTCNGEVVAKRQPHGRGGVALALKGKD